MNKGFIFIFCIPFLLLLGLPAGHAQYLSNLSATAKDPVYTTYAAPPEKTTYRLDQAYDFRWNDPDKPIAFTSAQGGEMGILFEINHKKQYFLKQSYKKPTITASYSDILKYYYYPIEGIRAEVVFNVHNSQTAIIETSLVNEHKQPFDIEIVSYFYQPDQLLSDIGISSDMQTISFGHVYNPDGWMRNQNIPVVISRKTNFSISQKSSTISASPLAFEEWLRQPEGNFISVSAAKIVAFKHQLHLAPGKRETFRIVRHIHSRTLNLPFDKVDLDELFTLDMGKIILENEKLYATIPQLKNLDSDYQAVYYNAFTLMRQCMMPPEGECGYNYYVFSREPKWGWGYGGQVFHESLSMLAYALMDPKGAMNSQRIYMQRQHPNGYINYRTGPYLNESIEYEGRLTSSAPWYNWQNFEIYKLTKDEAFLKEAYDSGSRFYNYYTANRDENRNGLFEWGAHALLESVRDARVAVWDKVGWPANFEGPDINTMLVVEAQSLAAMASLLKLTEEAADWSKKAEDLARLVNHHLWDDQDGFYYNVNRTNQSFSFNNPGDLKIKEIIGFLPLWAGITDSVKTSRLIACLTNSEEFWLPYGVSTLSASNDYYNPIGYWNGPVWLPWQYLVFRGLMNHGRKDLAEELVAKTMKNIIYHLRHDHVFWEFYSADHLQAGWNKTYIWTGIIARMLYDLENEQ